MAHPPPPCDRSRHFPWTLAREALSPLPWSRCLPPGAPRWALPLRALALNPEPSGPHSGGALAFDFEAMLSDSRPGRLELIRREFEAAPAAWRAPLAGIHLRHMRALLLNRGASNPPPADAHGRGFEFLTQGLEPAQADLILAASVREGEDASWMPAPWRARVEALALRSELPPAASSPRASL